MEPLGGSEGRDNVEKDHRQAKGREARRIPEPYFLFATCMYAAVASHVVSLDYPRVLYLFCFLPLNIPFAPHYIHVRGIPCHIQLYPEIYKPCSQPD